MAKFPLVNVKGDLFATLVGFGGQAVIKLISSVILTRLLAPNAYGIVTIILSIVYMVELLADLNVALFVVRDVHGEDRRYLDTAWTMRLVRSALNAAFLYIAAPYIATHIYDTPELVLPLRLFSLSFLIGGMASMSFTLAVRRKNARVIIYSELLATAVSTVFTIAYCRYSGSYWGLVFGIMLNRCMISIMSYMFYRDKRPHLAFEWSAAKEILQFTKYTMPSSLVTIGLSQFDKVALLKFFDLSTLGIYGLAGNISGPIDSLIGTTTQRVLYPRCANNFRENRDTFAARYYSENIKLFALILFLPASLAGAAQLVIAVLYDARYAPAALTLQAFGLRSILVSLQASAEDVLIAAGSSEVMLYGNILRAVWIVGVSLLGYHFFGFMGFVYGVATCGLPALAYLWGLQYRKGIMIIKYEMLKILFAAVVAISAFAFSALVMSIFHVSRIRFSN